MVAVKFDNVVDNMPFQEQLTAVDLVCCTYTLCKRHSNGLRHMLKACGLVKCFARCIVKSTGKQLFPSKGTVHRMKSP